VDLKIELDEGEMWLFYLMDQLDDCVGVIFGKRGDSLGQTFI